MSEWLKERQSGVLLHISSLPGGPENGDLGDNAYRFVDYLVEAGFSVWQVLPLGPTLADGSPYQSPSANAGNPAFICTEKLRDWGWLAATENTGTRQEQLSSAYDHFLAQGQPKVNRDYQKFCGLEEWWLEDFALFEALKSELGGTPWWDWPAELRDRDPEALESARVRLSAEVGFSKFTQFVFDLQWHSLRGYANEKGIKIFGDLPIFVAEDAVDVWVNRDLFELDGSGRPIHIAGVPPDYFSATGQRWGNPLYRWDVHARDGYQWWTRRMRRQLELFDLLRIDHFRGFESNWAIPSSCETAIDGDWRLGPGAALFDAMEARLGVLPVVAEDLGIITPEVEALRDRLGYPGMKILQFAFDGRPENPYLPHNLQPLSVVYTGTHDNDTSLGWFEGLNEDQQAHIYRYLGSAAGTGIVDLLVRTALSSVSRLALVPAQDLLGLGADGRMNTPGVTDGNWGWRLADLAELRARSGDWRSLNELYGRLKG